MLPMSRWQSPLESQAMQMGLSKHHILHKSMLKLLLSIKANASHASPPRRLSVLRVAERGDTLQQVH